MVRRGSINLLFLFCLFFACSFELANPCMAQESANLGIFSATADWGLEPEFGPKLRKFKVPGRCEVSKVNGEFVYDIYGNGSFELGDQSDEGFFLYATRSGSWRLSARIEILTNCSESSIPTKAGLMVRENGKNPVSRHLNLNLDEYPFGHSLRSFYVVNELEKMESSKFEYFSDQNFLHLRITRIFPRNLFITEWSIDGIQWNILNSSYLYISEEIAYGIMLNNHYAEVNELSHIRVTNVILEPAKTVVRRTFSAEHFAENSMLEVTLELYNSSGGFESVVIDEYTPDDWSISSVTEQGTVENNHIHWSLDAGPGSTYLRYYVKSSQNPNKSATFHGTTNDATIGGTNTIAYSTIDIPKKIETLFYDTLLITLFLMMAFVHLFLFIYYPVLKENLYFTLFLVSVSCLFYSISQINNYRNFSFVTTSQLVGIIATVTNALFIFTLSYRKLSKYFWIIIITALILAVCYLVAPMTFELSTMLFHGIVYSLFFMALLQAIRNRVDGIWIITFGLVVLIGTVIYYTVSAYLFNFQSIFAAIVMKCGLVFYLLSVSIYLTQRSGRSNKELHKLNIELEDRVEQRTRELEQANDELDTTNQYLNNTNVELQEANAQLIQLDQMKTQFVSQASHDLRTPLTAIKGSLDNLLMGIAGALTEKQQKVMLRATTSVDRLTNLINDVLDLNRIETGRIVLEKSDIPFKALVENIFNENHPAAEQKNIQLTFNASDGDYTLNIDGSKIERVVGELISNAIKYTPESGTVSVSLVQEENSVSLSVKDSGIGMSQEECAKIWDRFYRTNASKKFAKGSGLGLSIAKELVELHNGSLSVQSKQGERTVFILQLPVGEK